MKERYEQPVIEMILFDEEDVIATSGRITETDDDL